MELDSSISSSILSDIIQIEQLLNSKIFTYEYSDSYFVISSFICVIICLRDLTWKSLTFTKERIAFNEDIPKIEGVNDITDLIKVIRDAVCHPESPNHYLIPKDSIFSYNVCYGKVNALQLNDLVCASDYEDDVCFFFGRAKIYLNRHIIRAFSEAKHNLLPYL